MPEQVACEGLRVRRDIEPLVGSDTRIGARCDVPHGIPAGFSRRQPRVGEPAHRRLHVVQLDEVELDILTRRDMSEPARIAVGDIRQRFELVARNCTLRNLHTQHLRVVGLPLSVRAAHEPELPPLVGRHLATLVALERGDELVDVGAAGERQSRPPVGFWIVYD